jgi:hypothetical protein
MQPPHHSRFLTLIAQPKFASQFHRDQARSH